MLTSLADRARLLPSEAMTRRERDVAYLLRLTPENLLRSHYLEAGLIRMNGKPTDIHWGWDSPTSDIRGTVAGHWLSAAAHIVRETGHGELLARARFIVREIARCQAANGGRWAFPIPEKYLYWLRDGRHPWAPQYVCHKNMMGLLDMYKLTGDDVALEIAKKCADWFYDFTNDISRETMSDMMDREETGGLMEYWADLYAVTGDLKHLELMRRYERPRLAEGLLSGVDMLTNMHANATVPEMQGYARAYEVTGEARYLDVVRAYWRQAVTERGAFATGGQTCGEVWTPLGELAARLGDRNQEHCVVYNMMRLSEYLLRLTGESQYADYWEKGLWNGIFAQGFYQEPGNELDGEARPVTTVAYYLPMQPGAVKRWGSETEHFWCCHCTLLQANAIHYESIYYRDGEGLCLAQYIPSTVETEVNGAPARLTLTEDTQTGGDMMTDSPVNRAIRRRPNAWVFRLRVEAAGEKPFAIRLRLPDWLDGEACLEQDQELTRQSGEGFSPAARSRGEGALEVRRADSDTAADEKTSRAVAGRTGIVLDINGVAAPYTVENGFARLTRVWKDDEIRVCLPKKLACAPLSDDTGMVAFVDGPVCLAGLVGEEHLLYGDAARPEGTLLVPDDERAWQSWKHGWKTHRQPFGIRFRPLYEIGTEPYTVYFPVEPR